MSNSISGGISFSGIGSGTDFAAMLEQLKEVESFRLYSLQDSREDASETYEAFQELLDTVSEAQESLSLLNTREEFLTKIASSSNEATLGVKADANAVDGTHKIEVLQLASNAIWANKGSYPEKTTVINSSGVAQDFSYTYKGETRTLSVPAGTTLEGFANMVNQDKANPGVHVSILKTGSGYSFQMSGSASGADATLDIHPSSLTGLSGSGGTWESSASVDLTKQFNDGQTTNSYTYTLTLQSGATFTTDALSGDATQEEIITAINSKAAAQTPPLGDIASIDADGKMTILGMREMTTTITSPSGISSSTSVESLPQLSFTLQGNLTSHVFAGPETYSFTNADGGAVEVTLDGRHTQKDILNALKAEGYAWTSKVNGNITEVSIEGLSNAQALLDTDTALASSTSSTSFTVNSADLDTLHGISGTTNYNFVDDASNPFTVSMVGSHSARDVLDALQDRGYSVSASATGSALDVSIEGVSDISALEPILPGSETTTTSASLSIGGALTDPVAEDRVYTFANADGSAPVSINMAAGHTTQDLLDELTTRGIAFSTVSNTKTGRTEITFDGMQSVSGFAGAPPTSPAPVWADYTQQLTLGAPLQNGVVPSTMEFSFQMQDGTVNTVTVAGSDTMESVLASAGLAYTVDPDTNKLSIDGVTSITGIPSSIGIKGSLSGSDAWEVQASQDAIFKVDNWPQELTSSTNEVSEVLEGVTLSLRDVGTAQITVAADTDSVKANIQTVLDAVNSVLKKVQDLTAITEDVTTYDDEGNATLVNTQGSALTGDYSTQLFISRFKSAASSHPPGFQPMEADDIFSGDFISSLAQLGIKVSADTDSPDFGLFAIAPHGSTEAMQALDQETFDKAIAENLEDVIAFFASSSTGRSSSPDFRYANHIDGLTEPGTYDVTYNIALDGSITDVFINGALATQSETNPNTFSVGGDAGAAGGMSITVDNLSAGSYSGTVSVQQGKVGQLEDFLANELKYVDPKLSDPTIGSENGGLKIAEAGAKALIEQLDTKIGEEQERLERWEETERLKYARLDTLLGEYNGQMEMLTQQLTQLA